MSPEKQEAYERFLVLRRMVQEGARKEREKALRDGAEMVADE